MSSEIILHMCSRGDWETAQQLGAYVAASLETEGFIHFSRPEQVAKVANAFYADVPDMALLHVEVSKLTPEVKWEAADGDMFPHVYGAVNLDAVVAVEAFVKGDDGVYRYPAN